MLNFELNFVYQDVVLACGCSGALELALDVLLNPGDNVLLPKPGFSIYQTLSIAHGYEVRHYNLLVRNAVLTWLDLYYFSVGWTYNKHFYLVSLPFYCTYFICLYFSDFYCIYFHISHLLYHQFLSRKLAIFLDINLINKIQSVDACIWQLLGYIILPAVHFCFLLLVTKQLWWGKFSLSPKKK